MLGGSDFKQTLLTTLSIIRNNNIQHSRSVSIPDKQKLAIFGDIHGDFETLVKAYDIAKSKKCKYYVFCGDYIDKGPGSIECFKFVLDLFNTDWNHNIILIGNHEQFFCWQMYDELLNMFNDEELMSLTREVIDNLPIGVEITFKSSWKRIFCSHGAYPFIFKPKIIRLHDPYEIVWKHFGLTSLIDQISDELVYESNTELNISPTDYINKIYDDFKYISSLIIESPYKMALFNKFITKLNELKQLLTSTNPDKSKIDSLTNDITKGEWNRHYDCFIKKLKQYREYYLKYEQAKQSIIDLRNYMLWGDMFIVNDPEIEKVNSWDSFCKFIRDHKTQFFAWERGEIKRHNLQYPISQLKEWMEKSNINFYIRGHQSTMGLCEYVNLKTNEELSLGILHENIEVNMNKDSKPINSVPFTKESLGYITLHTTTSYGKETNGYKIPKFVIINNDKIESISIIDEQKINSPR